MLDPTAAERQGLERLCGWLFERQRCKCRTDYCENNAAVVDGEMLYAGQRSDLLLEKGREED